METIITIITVVPWPTGMLWKEILSGGVSLLMEFQCILFISFYSFIFFVYVIPFYFDFSSFAQFIPESYVDGRKRIIKFGELANSLIAATLPHFWTSAGMTHNIT